MGPKPRISLERRGTVLALSREGYTQRQIAGKVGCSQRSASDILKKKQLTGSVKDLKIPGKKRKTTQRDTTSWCKKVKLTALKPPQRLKPRCKTSMQCISLFPPHDGDHEKLG
jgi:transposase